MKVFVLIHDREPKFTRTFYSEDKKLFEEENKKGWAVYFSVNDFEATQEEMHQLKAKTKRNIPFLKKLVAVFADLDIAKKGDGQTREQKELKKKILLDAMNKRCRPTFVIDTSNGLQPLWFLNPCGTDSDTQKKYVNTINGIIEWSRQYGGMGDKVKDVTRILRMPGYYHMKEEPYLCTKIQEEECKYDLETLSLLFPFDCKKEPQSGKEKKVFINTELSPIDKEIAKIDFRKLIIKAFSGVGRHAEFDKENRLVLDGRLTGTFQGKHDDRNYLASTSHEPFEGNRVTAVAQILGVAPKFAREWIIREYQIDYGRIIAKEQLSQIKEAHKVEYKRRYTWGTPGLDMKFAIIKRTDFIVFGGKRGNGKTTYTFDLACKNAALGHKVLYLSLEMDSEELIDDFARRYAGITIEEEYHFKIPEHKQASFDKKKKELQNKENLIFRGMRRGQNLVWETIRSVIEEYEILDLVIIDNLDRIGANRGETNNDKQIRIVDSIMSFTAERQVPVILIHHFRKGNDSRKRSDDMDELSGSGKIADGADRVVKIIRNKDPEAFGKERYETKLFLLKARGYCESQGTVYFHKGIFVDSFPDTFDFARQIFNS
jgi:hypothetical protein